MNQDTPDSELLLAWREGDATAGNRLVRRHFEPLYRFFRSRVDDGVADLVQQTFLGALESRARIPAEAFRPYLFGIARKKLLLVLRGERREDDALDRLRAEEGPEATMSGVVGRRAEQRLLFRALRRLPVDLQLALLLSYWENLSMAEIGEILEVPPGTVKSRLHRARELLREAIDMLAPDAATATVTVGDLDRWARELRDELDPKG